MQPVPVSAVVNVVKEFLEASEFFSDLWVVGEVSNYSRSQQGHRYFSLKDSGGVLRTVLFRDTMPGMQLENGDHVLAHGRVTVYPLRGELQFVCNFVRPEGVGILAARYEELKLRLDEEGLFDPSRKRMLPRFPSRIGLVTSPTGAALQDICNVLARRWPMAELLLSPAQVQGEQAAPDILLALRRLAKLTDLDLVIVARGGGAAEDLWAFNDERIARAIYGFPVPVVTGIGHETDETIADLVADLRAPTPSAAAERSVPSQDELRRVLNDVQRGAAQAAITTFDSLWARVTKANDRIEHRLPRVTELRDTIDQWVARSLLQVEQQRRVDAARLQAIDGRLRALDPRTTLARGYAIVQDVKTGKVVTSVRMVKSGHRLSVGVSDGAFWTEVS